MHIIVPPGTELFRKSIKNCMHNFRCKKQFQFFANYFFKYKVHCTNHWYLDRQPRQAPSQLRARLGPRRRPQTPSMASLQGVPWAPPSLELNQPFLTHHYLSPVRLTNPHVHEYKLHTKPYEQTILQENILVYSGLNRYALMTQAHDKAVNIRRKIKYPIVKNANKLSFNIYLNHETAN